MAHTTEEPQTDPRILQHLIERVTARQPLDGGGASVAVHDPSTTGSTLYANRNERLGIDLTVERLAFPNLQTLDPRIVRIAPASASERHRHAHETLFVVLAGHGDVLIGERWWPVRTGDLAFAPRWVFHQTRNGSATEVMVVLAVTDFGFTSALLGADDRRTRLADNGEDALAEPAL
jgi:quercetin dioxygenase-like cupin family protein